MDRSLGLEFLVVEMDCGTKVLSFLLVFASPAERSPVWEDCDPPPLESDIFTESEDGDVE